MFTQMLIPLDGSKTAEKVLPYARFVAGTLKLPVELLGSCRHCRNGNPYHRRPGFPSGYRD